MWPRKASLIWLFIVYFTISAVSQATCRYGWWAVNLQVCGIKPSCLNEKQYPDIYAQKLAKTTMPLWPRFEPWPHGYKTECYPFSIFTWVNLEHTHTHIHRVSHESRSLLRESVPYVKIYRYNPKHLYPKLNGYGDNGQRNMWASGVSTYCTPSVTPYSSTAHARQRDVLM